MIVAIVGAGPTRDQVYSNPVDQVWTFNHLAMQLENEIDIDLSIDIHFEDEIREPSLGPEIDKYWAWLQQPHDFPILMQAHDPRFPSSKQFPKHRVKENLPDRPMASSLDWLLGLAALLEAKEIYTYGCMFGSETEYKHQVGGNYYWTGVLEERGIKIIPAEGDSFFFEQGDYGYTAWVRISRKVMSQDFKSLKEAHSKEMDGDNILRYIGAIDCLRIMLGWTEGGLSVGRNAFERLYGEIWNEVIGGIALHRHGVMGAEKQVYDNEGRLCVLLHYLRVCDLLPSELEIKQIDTTTKKPIGIV